VTEVASQALADMQRRVAEEMATWNRLRDLERRVQTLERRAASLEEVRSQRYRPAT
jgi:hypothetical protein